LVLQSHQIFCCWKSIFYSHFTGFRWKCYLTSSGFKGSTRTTCLSLSYQRKDLLIVFLSLCFHWLKGWVAIKALLDDSSLKRLCDRTMYVYHCAFITYGSLIITLKQSSNRMTQKWYDFSYWRGLHRVLVDKRKIIIKKSLHK
jgi:hypothetical protein